MKVLRLLLTLLVVGEIAVAVPASASAEEMYWNRQVRNAYSQLCMTDSGDHVWVKMKPCGSAIVDGQSWQIDERTIPGYYMIYTMTPSGRWQCLTAAWGHGSGAAPVFMTDCDASDQTDDHLWYVSSGDNRTWIQSKSTTKFLGLSADGQYPTLFPLPGDSLGGATGSIWCGRNDYNANPRKNC